MKLKYSFEIVEIDNHYLAVPLGREAESFSGIIKMNETARDIFTLLYEDTTREVILDKLSEKYRRDENIANKVEDFIGKLRKADLLE